VLFGGDGAIHVLDLSEIFVGKEAKATSYDHKSIFAGNAIISVDFGRPSPNSGSGIDGRGSTRRFCVYRSEAGEVPVQEIVCDTSVNPYYDYDTACCTIPPFPFPRLFVAGTRLLASSFSG